MTLRIETDAAGEPLTMTLDGATYTLDQLRNHIARSKALTTVARWLDQELRTSRRQRRTIRVLCHVVRRLSVDLPTHTAFLQAQHNRRLNADPAAPWVPRAEQAQYAQERAASTKE